MKIIKVKVPYDIETYTHSGVPVLLIAGTSESAKKFTNSDNSIQLIINTKKGDVIFSFDNEKEMSEEGWLK